MTFPFVPGPATAQTGETYAVMVVMTADAAGVERVLRQIRFTGWIAPPAAGRLLVMAVPGRGTIAAGRRGIVDVGATTAAELDATVLAVRVIADRQLALVAWTGAEELGRYVSDPSREPGAEDDVLDDPIGVRHAAAFAQACGQPERAADLADVLTERLDPDSFIESERLARTARLLDLPTWLVAAATLPRDIPTGPRARDLTRLGVGLPGVAGLLADRLVRPVRRRRPPPPVLTDPPRGGSDMDPWLM